MNEPTVSPVSNVYDGSSDSLIYAISSVGGEVMYHVSHSRDKHNPTNKKFLSTAAKHILALTTMSKDKFITENIELPDYEVPYMGDKSCSGQQHMSVLVNPFSQHPWLELDDMTQINRNPSSGNLSSSTVSSRSSHLVGTGPPAGDSVLVREQMQQDTNERKEASTSPHDETSSSPELVEKPLSSHQVAESIVEEILERVVQRCAPLPPLSDPDSSSSADTPAKCTKSELKPPDMTLHPLHSHMLLYTQLVDSGQCLYGLSLLKNIIEAEPKLSLLSLASTGVSSLQPPSVLMVLLARHKRCVFGQGFDGGNVSEMIGQYRSTMYLQVLITVCLYYLRSYYPRLPHLRLKDEHLSDNQEVQVVATEVLVLVFTNLSSLVADSPRGLAPYVLDLLTKCKVQKCVLHCLLATVHAMRLPGNTINGKKSRAVETKTFTQELLDYNNRGNVSQETYLSSAMDLTLALIKLEDALASASNMDSLPREVVGSTKSGTSSSHYYVGQPIPAQPMFLRVVSSALGQKHTRHLHSAWLHLFTSALPHMGPTLPNNCLRLCSLLCVLIEELPKYYTTKDLCQLKPIPPDYALTLLSALTTIAHFCLLDPSQSPSTVAPSATSYVSGQNPSLSASNSNLSTSASLQSQGIQTTGQILFNLLHVFSPVSEVMEASLDMSGQDPLVCARRTLLSHLPRIVAALLSLWTATAAAAGTGEANADGNNNNKIIQQNSSFKNSYNSRQNHRHQQHCLAGSHGSVVHQIVSFLSPICHHHAPHFLAAISVVWQVITSDIQQCLYS